METNQKSQLRCAGPLVGSAVETKDGDACGKCRDFLFDDENWTIRYVVVDTGGLFSRDEVLLSPFLVDHPDFGGWSPHLRTKVDGKTIEDSPPLDTEAPVSREYESELARHYQYPLYWAGAGLWGLGPYPVADAPDPEEERRHERAMEDIGKSHLRSFDEVRGYAVAADGEDIGKVDDIVVEIRPWRIRYVVIMTGSWLSERRVVFAPDWIDEISWSERKMELPGQARAKIEEAPEFDPYQRINRDDEGKLYDYYGHRPYW